MMRNWLEVPPIAASDALRAVVGGAPLIADLLARRGITNLVTARAFLDPDAYTPADPFDLPDMGRAVDRIRRAIADRETICIWGDFDVDGQTATALLTQGLSAQGAQVVHTIPNRLSEGHGVHIPALGRQIDAGARLIVTCDTGISAHAAIDYAQTRGIDVIVTDHHHLPETLPRAYANINPQRLGHTHPLHTLPGVGVAYELIRAMTGDQAVLLDLVALGIVADVAVQTGDTRYLLQRGLTVLRAALRPGIAALADQTGTDPTRTTEQTIGFSYAPRLNAAGRLDDAQLGVDLLLATQFNSAQTTALRLEALNAQRRLLCDQIEDAAEAQIARDRSLLAHDVLILAHPDWHTGVVGIVANRLVDRYNMPVILLATPPGEEARGSARSVDGVDITEGLVATAHLLNGYGGHAMAAGMRLAPDNIPAFRRGLSKFVRAVRGEVIPGALTLDATLTLPELTLDLMTDLERLAPFGAGNPPVVIAVRDLTLSNDIIMGRDRTHRRLTVTDNDDHSLQVLWWNGADEPFPEGRFDLACVLRANDYQGNVSVQAEFIDARPITESITINSQTTPIIDHRNDPDPAATLQALWEQGNVQIWREDALLMEQSQRRHELTHTPGTALAIWMTPPDLATLRAALKQVGSVTAVHVFAIDPSEQTGYHFTRRVLGLAKYAIQQKDGVFDLYRFAIGMESTSRAARLAIEALVASGKLVIVDMSPDQSKIVIALGQGTPQLNKAAALAALEAVLTEIAAFRAFFRRANLNTLIDG